MPEIEIRSSGELILHSEVVGHIQWFGPAAEMSVVGVYCDEEEYHWQLGQSNDCGCLSDEEAVARKFVKGNLATALAELRALSAFDLPKIAILDRIDTLIAGLELGD
ncbi:MAG: hypothetical protein AAF618_05010 [Pseudomonadota bacterium]